MLAPQFSDKFPDSISVIGWHRQLLQFYCSRDPVSGPANRLRRTTLTIAELRRYKARKGFEHE